MAVDEFANRVLGIRRKNKTVPLAINEESDDPVVVASESVPLLSEFEKSVISYPRASSLHSACMRMHVIGTVLEKEKISKANISLRLTYGIGNALHRWIQNEPDVFGDKRRGWWRCTACNTILYFGAPPKKKCSKCGARPEAMIYHEHYMRITKPYHVTGHPDLFIYKNKTFRVVEAKTMNPKDFDKLVAPLAEHEWQILTYMWGLQKDKRMPVEIDKTVGYVAYIAKKLTVKEFPIKMYPVAYSEQVIKRITAKLRVYDKGVQNYPNSLPVLDEACERQELAGYKTRFCPVGTQCKKFHREGK